MTCESGRRRVLLISVNPWPLWIATERHLAMKLSADCIVDGLNACALLGQASPQWSLKDRINESIARKFDRFVTPVLNGEDITQKIKPRRREIPPVPKTVDALREYSIARSKIGLAALSTAASLSKVADNVATTTYGTILENSWRLAHEAHYLAEDVAHQGYDEIYIYNGRHCVSRPFCDTLSGGATVFKFESGGKPNSFILTDKMIQAPDTYAAMVLEMEVNKAAGHQFFKEQKDRVPGTSAHFFTNSQILGKIPEVLDRTPLVTYFSSSPDEFFAISDDFRIGDFGSQGELGAVLACLCNALGLKLVIRLHPHLAQKHHSWKSEWDFDGLRRQGAVVISPEDPYDSYALMAASLCVVTCGSTIGTEAVYWNVPSLAVGHCFTNTMGITVPASNVNEVELFLRAPSCLPGARDRALAFGSYERTSGESIPGFSSDGTPETARIDGVLVDPLRFLASRIGCLRSPSF